MRLELTHFRQAATEVSRTFAPGEFQEAEDYRVVAPAVLAMTVHKDGDRFRLVGSVASRLELSCSRCLEGFAWPIDQRFDLRYWPADTGVDESADRDDEREVADDDVSMTFYQDDVIELSELLREQFYLSLPMKPLCQSECRGLCPQCGANRNMTPCGCQPHWEDPRMAALKTLMSRRE